MPNSDLNQPQTLHSGHPCSIQQSHYAIQAPPNIALQRVELLFFLYLLITLSLGMYHTYRLAWRRRRIQSLERSLRLNAPRRTVCEDLRTTTANRVYEPIPLPISKPVTDTLSALDIPLGQGGFARDYTVSLVAGNQVVIELKSERFDTFVSLLADDGTTIDENDDGPDGTTNSWLDVHIPKSGTYTVRVRASGDKAVGPFTLFVRRFYPQSGNQ